jgi:hypothetical protein
MRCELVFEVDTNNSKVCLALPRRLIMDFTQLSDVFFMFVFEEGNGCALNKTSVQNLNTVEMF